MPAMSISVKSVISTRVRCVLKVGIKIKERLAEKVSFVNIYIVDILRLFMLLSIYLFYLLSEKSFEIFDGSTENDSRLVLQKSLPIY